MSHAKTCAQCAAPLPDDAPEGAVCAACEAIAQKTRIEPALADSTVAPQIRETIGDYEVIDKLGQGGMGAVYRARQISLGRLVALKVLPGQFGDDPEFLGRFQREAKVAASLNHANLVRVYASGSADGAHYIAMELIDGENLHQRMRRGRMPIPEALRICAEVARGLQCGWDRAQLVHRDIKPSNIYLSQSGEVKVGDLGIAKSLTGNTTGLTQTGTMIGTPYYMSPEQCRGDRSLDFRADIYSLGCTLYELLTGQPPYPGSDPIVIVNQHLNAPLPAIMKALPGCPMPLVRLVGKMLKKQPRERHSSYEDLIAEMDWVREQIESGAAVTAAPRANAPAITPLASTPRPQTTATQQTSNLTLWIGVAAAVVVLAGAAFLLTRPKPAPVRASAAPAATPTPSTPLADRPARTPDRPGEPGRNPPPRIGNDRDFHALFDGQTFAGWKAISGGKVPADWRIADGLLIAGQKSCIRTEEEFEDFELELDWRVSANGNGGVYYRVPATSTGAYPVGSPEVQLIGPSGAGASRSGDLFKVVPATEDAARTPGEWNRARIVVRGGRAEHWINDRKVCTYELDSSGWPALAAASGFAEAPAFSQRKRGAIALQGWSGEVAYRNLRIRAVGPGAPGEPPPRDSAHPANETVDLLALIDPARDSFTDPKDSRPSSVRRESGKLIIESDGPPREFRAPMAIRSDDYELELRIGHHITGGYVKIEFPLGAERGAVHFAEGTGASLEVKDKAAYPVHPGPDATWPRAEPRTFKVRIQRGRNGEPDRITTSENGAAGQTWSGTFAGLPDPWVSTSNWPHKTEPTVGFFISYLMKEIESFTLRTFSTKPKPPGTAQSTASDPAASQSSEPGAIRLWDTPEKITADVKGFAWKDDALFIDSAVHRVDQNNRPLSYRDSIVRFSIRANRDAKWANIVIRDSGVPTTPRNYQLSINPPTGACEFKVADKSPHRSLKAWTLPRAYGESDWMHFELRATGPDFTVSVDGQVVATIHDETLSGPGFLHFGGTANCYFRDIVLVPLDQPAPAAEFTFGGHRYQLLAEPLTWTAAKAKAEAMGGHLATINTPEESSFVRYQIVPKLSGLSDKPSSRRLILGASRPPGGAEWQWVTGELFDPGLWVGPPTVKPPADTHYLVWDFGNKRWDIVSENWAIFPLIEWDTTTASPAADAPPSSATATKDAPFVNSLGMKFVPVPITGGPTSGKRVLFSVWETRVQDYEVFANDTQRAWMGAPDLPKGKAVAAGPDYPAAWVRRDDAQAFCAWLTERERKAGRIGAGERYRLPTDYEWSCAVGIGDRQDPAKPTTLRGSDAGTPWSRWPPPAGAGNIAGEEVTGTSGATNGIAGYRDGFITAAPVGSFAASPLGLFDLMGNVQEWVEDDLAPGEAIQRGGSYFSRTPASLDMAGRFHPTAVRRAEESGFRVVLAPAP